MGLLGLAALALAGFAALALALSGEVAVRDTARNVFMAGAAAGLAGSVVCGVGLVAAHSPAVAGARLASADTALRLLARAYTVILVAVAIVAAATTRPLATSCVTAVATALVAAQLLVVIAAVRRGLRRAQASPR
jgi:hypothetical protein